MNFSIRDLYENIIEEITFTNMIIKFFLFFCFLFLLSCLTSIKSTKLVYYIVDFSEILNYTTFSMEYLIPIMNLIILLNIDYDDEW